jgi:hypothetical protein
VERICSRDAPFLTEQDEASLLLMLCFLHTTERGHFHLVLVWFNIRLESLSKVLRKFVVQARSERMLHRSHENVNFR